MFFYGWMFFTLGMLVVWVLVMLYTLFIKPKQQSPSTLRRVLYRSGILLLVYVLVVVISGTIYDRQYTKECGPNPKDVAIIKPMAERMSGYIVENGMPKSLKDISGLPYKVYQNPNEDESFYHFRVNGDSYIIFDKGSMLEFESEIKRGNGYTWAWAIFKVDDNDKYTLERPIEYFLTNTDGICSSMRM